MGAVARPEPAGVWALQVDLGLEECGVAALLRERAGVGLEHLLPGQGLLEEPLRMLGDVVDGPCVEALEVFLELRAAPELEALSCAVDLVKVAWSLPSSSG